LLGGTDVPHYPIQRTQTLARSGDKSRFPAEFRARIRRIAGGLALVAILVAGPMLANPGSQTASLNTGLSASDALVVQTHRASIVDDIVDVIDDIIDDLTGGGDDAGGGGGRNNP
jgi:hypothetical protein